MGELSEYRRSIGSSKKIAFLLYAFLLLLFVPVLFPISVLYAVVFVPFIYLPLYLPFHTGVAVAIAGGYIMDSLTPAPSGFLMFFCTFVFVMADFIKKWININSFKAWLYTFITLYVFFLLFFTLLKHVVNVEFNWETFYFVKSFCLGLGLLYILFVWLDLKNEDYSSIRS